MRNHFLCWVREVYKDHKDVGGGIGLFHGWFLSFVIHWYKPDVVIESGAHMGFGTRFIRRALGDSKRIIVVSPETPSGYIDKRPDSVYFVGKDFKDFTEIDWDSLVPDKSRALIFFDDH